MKFIFALLIALSSTMAYSGFETNGGNGRECEEEEIRDLIKKIRKRTLFLIDKEYEFIEGKMGISYLQVKTNKEETIFCVF